MGVQPPMDTPADLYLLLGRIDGKVDGIAGTLAAMNTRADSHEARIGRLEQEDARRATYVPRFEAVEADVEVLKSDVQSAKDQGRTWLQAGAAAKAIIVGLIGVAAYFGFQVALTPSAPVAVHKTIETTTIPTGR